MIKYLYQPCFKSSLGETFAPNNIVYIKCLNCSKAYNVLDKIFLCSCGGLVEIAFRERPRVSWDLFRKRPFRLWRYRELVPVPDDAEIVSLSEGGTPLIKLVYSKQWIGVDNVYVKFEEAEF